MAQATRWFLILFALATTGNAEVTVDFNADVRPILSDRCYACHGPDGENRKAGLRLDLRNDALKQTESGLAAIQPGDPEHSEILRRILSSDPDEIMPPPKAKLSLTPAEKETLRRWIAQGAPYEEHWAFRPLTEVALPSVKSPSRVRNEIDHFTQARLEDAGWQLGDDAPRERLLRRLTFDLTGLPPTVDELDAFLADTSPDAYESAVDRLLRSDRYGERMTAEWMDVARYADSYGYQVDRDRFVWPWRDWVIKAFNQNLPYDSFITWQLAGDLLPNPTRDQILATTFNRLHSQKVEGGSVPEEFRVEYVADRTHTFGTAFLGLTVECSRCHDHKYDPITQREYYQLSAFFANIDEAGLYSYFTESIPTPTLLLSKPEEEKELHTLQSAISLTERELGASTHQVEALSGQVGYFTFDQRDQGGFVNAANAEIVASSSDANDLVPGHRGQAIKLTGDDGVDLKLGNFTRNQPFAVSWWMSVPEVNERTVVFHRSRAWTDAASRGYEVLLEDGRLKWSLIHYWPGNAISIRTLDALPVNTWVHVGVTYDGSSRADGLRVFVNGNEQTVSIVRDQLTKNITGGGGDHLVIGERFRDRGFADGLIDEFRIFERALTSDELRYLADQGSLPTAVSAPGTAEALQNLRTLREQRSQLGDPIQEIMVMREHSPPRITHVLSRGAYDAPADPVEPQTPAALPPMNPASPPNRLGLAQWLTDPDHPLTSRVTVNRYWQMFFGKGLVTTPEDFGSQGALPSHPKLLDWLAHHFVQNGWDLKALVRKIVLSQTYRQTSETPEALRAQDPTNIWLGRAPRYRMPAEMIRDQALYTSGLLVEELGGPPVKPYEVAASFKPVPHETGSGLYRRSLYTYWKRTSPAPVMIALDAAARDVCMVKRDITATPLQALVYLNDPQAVEAARVLALSLLKIHGQDPPGLLRDLFRRLTSRLPRPAEEEVLREMFSRQQKHFQAQPDQAKAFLNTGATPPPDASDVPTLAALTAVASTLFAYDECLMRR